MSELMGLSDRIMVMHEGEVSGFLNREEFSEETILSLAAGLNKGEKS
jgi:ABC-type sugar transport system ATPase subunit